MDIGEYRQPGSNGLAFDRDGRLTIALREEGGTEVLATLPLGRQL